MPFVDLPLKDSPRFPLESDEALGVYGQKNSTEEPAIDGGDGTPH